MRDMMKQILLLIMTFELILSPISLSLINTSHFRVQAEECAEGRYFDSTLNRCIIIKEVVDSKNQANACDGLEGDEYKNCFKSNVDKELSDAEKVKDIGKQTSVGGMSSALVPAVVSLGAAYVIFSKKELLQECGATSAWLIMGAGVATLLGEVLAQKSYKKKLKGMMSEYQSRMEEGSEDAEENIDIITSNQTIAFDYQIEQEKARKSAHTDREKTYKLAFGLYSAGVLAAVVEQFMYATGEDSTCNLDGKAETSTSTKTSYKPFIKEFHYIHDLKPVEMLEIVFRKMTTIFPSSMAVVGEETEVIEVTGQRFTPDQWAEMERLGVDQYGDPYDWGGDGISEPIKAGEEASKSIGEKVENALKTPWVRAAISGVLAMYSKKIADKAGKLKKQADKRIELLKDLRDGFVATGGAGFEICKDEDRKNPAKLGCYCYTKEGDKNPNRETSATCQNFWKLGKNVSATDYGRTSGYTRNLKRGCLKSDGQYSSNCCSNDVDKGKCTKVGGNFNLGQLGGLTGLSDTMKDTAKFINGKMTTGSLNGPKYQQLAISANKNLDKMRKNSKQAPLLKKIDKLRNKMEKGFAARVKRALANGSISPQLALGGLGSNSVAPKSAADVLKSMKKDFTKKNSTRSSSRSKKSGSIGDYDFGTGPDGGIEVDDIAKVMDKNYKINDVNNNSDHDIFKIITNRYHRSGLRRLFDANGISEADEANGSDLHDK
jgi:hypothetical protein